MANLTVEEDGGGDHQTLDEACDAIGAGETITIQGAWDNPDTREVDIGTNCVITATGAARVTTARHVSGTPTHYRLHGDGDHAITIADATPITSIDGIEIKQDGTGASNECIRLSDDGGELTVSNCILWSKGATSDQDGVYAGSIACTINLTQCIIYEFARAGLHGQVISGSDIQTFNVNSCSFYRCALGNGEASGGAVSLWRDADGAYTVNIHNTWALDCDISGSSTDLNEAQGAGGSTTWNISNSIVSDGSISSYADSGADNFENRVIRAATAGGDEVLVTEITAIPFDLSLVDDGTNNDAQDVHADDEAHGLTIPGTDIDATVRPQNTNYDVGAFEIPSGEGETYIRTINDSLGVTDVVGRTQVQVRTIADGVGSVDNMGRTQAQLRTLAESLGITDALKKAETRIFTDAVAITDVITKSQAFARTIADDIGIVHNAGWFGVDSGNLDSHCGEGDGTQLAWALDGANRWFHWSEHPPEHWFILDLGTSHYLTKFRSRSNQTDDPTKVDIYVSETNGNWGEAVASDIATWQDTDDWVEYNSVDKQGRFIKVIVTEVEGSPATGQLNWGKGPIFDVYYDDGVTRLMTYARTLAESLGITDALSKTAGYPRTVTDGVGITDSVSKTVTYARIVAEAMGVTDDVTKIQVQLRTIADTMGLTDAMTPGQVVTFAEAMGITDAMTRTKTQIRTIADVMGITDDLTRIAIYIFTQADDVGIADVMVRVAVALRTVSEDIGMTDEMSYQIGDLVKAAWAFMIIRQTHNN